MLKTAVLSPDSDDWTLGGEAATEVVGCLGFSSITSHHGHDKTSWVCHPRQGKIE